LLRHKHAWLKEEINSIKEASLYRMLNTMYTAPTTIVNINGEDKIVASSNNYLGLSTDRRLINAAKKALNEFGVGSGGSRLTTGNTIWHERLEKRIAQFKGAESGLVFSSGYLANIGVISSLAGKGDVILSDALNHASIIDGCRLSKATTKVYEHVNMESLKNKLEESMGFKRRFIVTDGVFSMDGNIAPLPEIVELANKYDAFVIVDDAHATGVLGKRGSGTSEYFNLDIDVVIGTFSKAVGTEGGYVVGSEDLIDYLRNKARPFIFQTAMPPSLASATIAAIDIIENDVLIRKRLQNNASYLRRTLLKMGYSVIGENTPIISIIIGDAKTTVQLGKRIEQEGVYAPAIRPPTVPDGQSRIRLTVMATHTQEQLDKICEVFQRVGIELGVI
jgi:8-amino-7-oxononanoate synthase